MWWSLEYAVYDYVKHSVLSKMVNTCKRVRGLTPGGSRKRIYSVFGIFRNAAKP